VKDISILRLPSNAMRISGPEMGSGGARMDSGGSALAVTDRGPKLARQTSANGDRAWESEGRGIEAADQVIALESKSLAIPSLMISTRSEQACTGGPPNASADRCVASLGRTKTTGGNTIASRNQTADELPQPLEITALSKQRRATGARS
jgi:hypothetical protein